MWINEKKPFFGAVLLKLIFTFANFTKKFGI